MSDSFRFSIRCGALSAATILLVAIVGRNPLLVLIAMATAAIITAVLIGKRKIADFWTRFRLAFGAAAIAAMCFVGLLTYARGLSSPAWVHLINITIWLTIAAVVGCFIAAVTGPQRPTHRTFDPV